MVICPKCGHISTYDYAHKKIKCTNRDCCYRKIWCLIDLSLTKGYDIETFKTYTSKWLIPYRMFDLCLDCELLPKDYRNNLCNLFVALRL